MSRELVPPASGLARGSAALVLREALHRLGFALVLSALALSPVSSLFKVVYGLPFPWIDPSLVLGAVALPFVLLSPVQVPRRHGRVLVAALAFLAAYWGCTLAAIARSEFAAADFFREPVKMTLLVALTIASAHYADAPGRQRTMLATLVPIVIAELLWAVYLLAAAVLPVPLPGVWRDYAMTYWFRQALYSGGIAVPRLGGTFIEAPPFGLFMLCSLVMLVTLGRHAGDERPRGRRARIAAAVGMVASWSSQVLLAGAIWGIVGALPRMLSARIGLVRRALIASGVILCVAAGSGVVVYRILQSPEETAELGSSVGERRAHLERSVRLFGESPIVGVGPGLYGEVALRESNGLYAPTTSVQLLPAEILAETGLVGMLAFGALVMTLVAATLAGGDASRVGALLAILVASSFQASWRVPAVALAIGCILAAGASRDGHGAPR